MTAEVAAALGEVRERIAAAAVRAGRRPEEVLLVGASKGVAVELLARALAAGLRDLGENRAQELLAKAPALAAGPAPPVWHFVGALQRNKVARLAAWVTRWHSVDRPALGDTIAARAPGARVLVEVDLTGEPQRAGCPPARVPALVEHLAGRELRVEGLMTVAPQHGEPRRWFATLRELAATIGLRELSMGMSEDFEDAIGEGATIVRIGRALFGARAASRARLRLPDVEER